MTLKKFFFFYFQIRSGYGIKGFVFTVGTTVKVLVDHESRLRIFINDCDLGVAATGMPPVCYAVIDLNGRCEEISVIRSLSVETEKCGAPPAERQDSQKEKADLEIQEKYPEQVVDHPEKNYRVEVKRRHSKEMTKTEQKLSSSDSYNSGIQQISSHAASCSFQTDTDNFNTQIQQLTIDLKSDLQRSLDADSSVMTSSDTYNTELQMLSAQGNSQVNLDDLNIQIQQLTTSNSGVEISSNCSQNIPRSQSQPFLNKNSKELITKDEKIDEDKDEEGHASEISSTTIENMENEEEELANEANVEEKNENQSYMRNSLKNNLKTKRQPIASKLLNLSSQNLINSQSNLNRCHCDYFTLCLRFKNMLGLPGDH